MKRETFDLCKEVVLFWDNEDACFDSAPGWTLAAVKEEIERQIAAHERRLELLRLWSTEAVDPRRRVERVDDDA